MYQNKMEKFFIEGFESKLQERFTKESLDEEEMLMSGQQVPTIREEEMANQFPMMEEEMKKAKASEVKEEVKASTSSEQSATEVVDEVLDNANVEKTSIPNSTTTAEVSLREKYSKAFGFEGFDINK
ncbi:hypothetical protein EBR03_08635 [bacterium]|nr:hypothetical protein [bacterium]